MRHRIHYHKKEVKASPELPRTSHEEKTDEVRGKEKRKKCLSGWDGRRKEKKSCPGDKLKELKNKLRDRDRDHLEHEPGIKRKGYLDYPRAGMVRGKKEKRAPRE